MLRPAMPVRETPFWWADAPPLALGYAGHGEAMATYLGDVMADVILGRPDRNPFRDLPFQPIPLYHGRPWFLPLAGLWYKVRDWIE